MASKFSQGFDRLSPEEGLPADAKKGPKGPTKRRPINVPLPFYQRVADAAEYFEWRGVGAFSIHILTKAINEMEAKEAKKLGRKTWTIPRRKPKKR